MCDIRAIVIASFEDARHITPLLASLLWLKDEYENAVLAFLSWDGNWFKKAEISLAMGRPIEWRRFRQRGRMPVDQKL
jgi:hypothetical protein